MNGIRNIFPMIDLKRTLFISLLVVLAVSQESVAELDPKDLKTVPTDIDYSKEWKNAKDVQFNEPATTGEVGSVNSNVLKGAINKALYDEEEMADGSNEAEQQSPEQTDADISAEATQSIPEVKAKDNSANVVENKQSSLTQQAPAIKFKQPNMVENPSIRVTNNLLNLPDNVTIKQGTVSIAPGSVSISNSAGTFTSNPLPTTYTPPPITVPSINIIPPTSTLTTQSTFANLPQPINLPIITPMNIIPPMPVLVTPPAPQNTIVVLTDSSVTSGNIKPVTTNTISDTVTLNSTVNTTNTSTTNSSQTKDTTNANTTKTTNTTTNTTTAKKNAELEKANQSNKSKNKNSKSEFYMKLMVWVSVMTLLSAML